MYTRSEVGPLRATYLVIKHLFLAACVFIAMFAVVGYVAGWITFEHNKVQETATIEIDTAQMKANAERAVERSQELIEETGKKLRDIGRPESETVPTSKEVAPDAAEPSSEESRPPADARDAGII